jgi:hypothetical protein
MMRFDGLSRIAWAAISAGLCWLTERLLRAGNAFIASGHVTPAQVALALARALLRASERADQAAFPKISV